MITDIPDGKNTGSFLSISSSTNGSLNNVQKFYQTKNNFIRILDKVKNIYKVNSKIVNFLYEKIALLMSQTFYLNQGLIEIKVVYFLPF